MKSPILNISEVELESADPSRVPTGSTASRYDVRRGAVASRIGARKLGYRITAVAPGKTACPFHSHRVEEEMFFIIEGSGELRYGPSRYPLKQGDFIACPTGGAETAHQIINTGEVEMRYLAVSNIANLDICEYPDSGKIGLYAHNEEALARGPETMRHITARTDTRDYWDGE